MRPTTRHQKWALRHLSRLDGKHAVVTGANSGIGLESARWLLSLGAMVTLACRNAARAESARQRLLAEFPQGQISCMMLDLASFASIDAFAAELAERYEKIDVFLHCAGVYYPKEPETADRLPMTEGVNFVGTVRLAEAVLPLLGGEARMVFTTSLVDRFGKEKRAVDEGQGYAAYARSKALLSAYVLKKARERGEKQPLFVAAHPGITATELLSPAKTSHTPLFSRLGHAFLFLFTHKKDKAALTCLMAAAGDAKNGDCIGPRAPFGISGYPHRTRFCRNVRRLAAKDTAEYLFH